MLLIHVTHIKKINKFPRISVSLDSGETGVFQKLPQLNAIDQYKCMRKDSV